MSGDRDEEEVDEEEDAETRDLNPDLIPPDKDVNDIPDDVHAAPFSERESLSGSEEFSSEAEDGAIDKSEIEEEKVDGMPGDDADEEPETEAGGDAAEMDESVAETKGGEEAGIAEEAIEEDVEPEVEDDGTTVDEEAEQPEAKQVETHDDYTPIERKAGPESDMEQPLADHVEEMIKRLGIVIVVAGLVSLAAFPFGEDFIIFLWYSVLPPDISQPHVYHPLELVITQLKAASLLGLVIALPVFVYETYAFMRPGLYPHERRYYLAAVPTSLMLAFVGLLFGYFLVLPLVMTYFLYYSEDVVDIAFALGQTFNLMLVLLGYLAIVFQIPLFVMLAIMMGLTTRAWLEDKRLIFWGAFLGISFLFSPDPTGMAPLLVAATMIALFEGTLFMLRWTDRGLGR